ncbi:MAG: PAS domain S-box protein [Nitrospirae bacterium]|nr:PAS domain S-box protein [Nitrospirota bacterium]
MSLKTKFLIGVVGLAVLLGLSVIFFVKTSVVEKLRAELLRKGEVMAHDMAEESIGLMLSEDILSLRERANLHKSVLPEIEYIFIQNSEGEVLVHTFDKGFPDYLKNANIIPAGQAQSIKALVIKKNRVFDIAVPIFKGEIGAVHVGMSEKHVREYVNDIALLFMGIVIAVFLFGVSAVIVFTATITKPLFNFIKGAEAVGKGDLNYKVHVRTNDEIGRLAESFNRMTGKLKITREELIKSNTEIEMANIEMNIAKHQLQLERDRAQNYLDIVGVIIIAIDADQQVSLINRKGCEVLGYSEDEIVGQNWFDNFIPERIRDGVKAVFDQCITGKVNLVEYYENPILTRNGEERLIAWHNTVWHDEAGNIIATISSGDDITQRKKIEDAIAKAKIDWEMTFDNAEELIALVDKGLNIMRCNKSFARFTGMPIKEILGRKCYEFFPADKGQMEYCTSHIQTGESMPKMEVKTETGQWLYVNHYPVFDEKGVVSHSILIITNITDLKNVQQRLMHSEEELKKHVKDLERFYDMAVDRELRMKDLKKELKRLDAELMQYKNPVKA